jgi:hypothetical protein
MKTFLKPVIFLLIPFLSVGQNIGIGNNNPSGPLSFPNTFGPKILLWGASTANDHYGIGYQSGQLQFYSDANFTQVSLGVGQSSTFSELLRIKGDGRVGIYNNDPAYTLDVAGRVRLSGYDSSYREDYYDYKVYKQPALFFNNNSNTVSPFYISTYGDRNIFGDYVGNYFGIFNSAGKLRLGTNNTGTLIVNESAGTAGQILRSGGANEAARWQNTLSADIYNQASNSETFSAYSISAKPVAITFQRSLYNDPSNNTYTLSGPSRILVKFDLNTYASECVACGHSTIDVQITYNGSVARTFRYSLANNTNSSVTGSALLTLPAGNYQIGLRSYLVGGTTVQVWGTDVYPAGHMTVHVIPKQ